MRDVVIFILFLVLALGLFSYAVLGQAAGAREMSAKSEIEMNKVSMLIDDVETVTGNTVKSYYNRALNDDDLTVDIDDEDGDKLEIDEVVDGAMFKMKKTYNEDGVLSRVDFDRIDMSSN
ncbi:hypothetical protein [Paramaledivibacter caminithermalis]|jgi:hypothetical protein|uniref:Uncharacterized protein n=1 Tax=Paramaledivibacter caminithermalis (strain DSM 15212 / CIP 107654 / DViRD3) TaxID=1121301 RepID=A0A1M6TRA9_PARC5|nr:hypothetical protein [Paramaledivibacter caminithermalis]SHK59505.1 hypothetical protein SAMN02745912_03771 [Paramaledivibacter caminithermalis DSM 15212]